MKQIRKKVEVHCYNCNAIILKDDSEVKRNEKLNRNNFCSKSCAGKDPVNLLHLKKIQPGVSCLISNNRRDEFTGFREHLARAKRRNQNVNITLEDLKNTWEQQRGICPYSKVKLQFVSLKNKNNPIYTMSLDRKNSGLGYIKGNIQFISIAMNLMKSSMSEEEMEQLLLIIRNSAN
jgi:hypothetical protein